MRITAALSRRADAPFELAEVELEDPRADEVLVEIRAAGICHTDLTMKAAWPPALSPSCSAMRARESSLPWARE